MTKLSTDDVIGKVHDLPSLPAAVVELLASLEREGISAEILAEKISYDQALVAKTLRLANSSFYGLQQEAATIQDAIAVLGTRSIGALVTAAVVVSEFETGQARFFDFPAFWRHSIGTALCAKELARQSGMVQERAFTAALLHDVGRLVLVTHFPRHYKATVAYRAEHDCCLIDAEGATLGIDHAVVGRALAQHWNFAPAILDAIGNHHAPDEGDAISLAGVVHVADAMAHALDLSGQEDDLVPPLSEVTWNRLGLGQQQCAEVFGETESKLEEVCRILTS